MRLVPSTALRQAPRRTAPLAAALALGLGLGGCALFGRAPPPTTWNPDRAPPAVAPAIARADAALGEFRQRLSRRLVEELTDPPHAVAVCRDEAPAIAVDVAALHGVGLGRTSHALRNPANAPPAWAAPFVAAAAGKKISEIGPVAVDLGDRIGLLRPIATGQGCLRCHGPAEAIGPGVRDALSRGYPGDRATGFAEGDLRGFFWAEAAR